MRSAHFTFTDTDNLPIFVYHWQSSEEVEPRGVVQIAHGMAETAARYEHFAQFLTDEGYQVYANDHRGHGRTAGDVETLGAIGEDGYNKMILNLHQVNELIHRDNPNLPVFLLGHSMGSFLVQKYMALFGHTVNGVILSGTNGKQSPLIHFAITIALREIRKRGETAKSPTLNQLLFRNYNKNLTPKRTDFDWLTRDTGEVDRYIADPYCGNILTTGFYYHFLRGLTELQTPAVLQAIPRDLPIFLISGTEDPVGNYGKGVLQLVRKYKSLQLSDVSYELYPGARHELLNETNRKDVMRDVLNWLNQHNPLVQVANA